MTDSRAVEDVLGELGEADELLLELAGALLELGDAGVLLRHDGGGGVRNEALVLELAADFAEVVERFRELLAEALASCSTAFVSSRYQSQSSCQAKSYSVCAIKSRR